MTDIIDIQVLKSFNEIPCRERGQVEDLLCGAYCVSAMQNTDELM